MLNRFIIRHHYFFSISALLLLIAVLYAQTLTPSISWQYPDSAELALAAKARGIAHPPGYPVYVMMAHLWQQLPLHDDLARRLNLFSLVWMLVAAGGIGYLCKQMADTHRLMMSASLVGMVVFATAPLVWSLAIVTEVYAMGMGVLSLIGVILWSFTRHRTRWKALLLGGLIGLSYGVMPMLLGLSIPLLAIAVTYAEGDRWRTGGYMLLGIIAGLSCFLYVPLRAITLAQASGSPEAMANWGRATTSSAFSELVTGTQYHAYGNVAVSSLRIRIESLTVIVIRSLHIWACVPAAVGLVWLWRREMEMCILLLSCIGLSGVVYLSYPVTGATSYLLPVVWSLTIAAGVGSGAVLKAMSSRKLRRLSLIGVACLLIANVGVTYPQVDASDHTTPREFVEMVLKSVPAETIVLTDSDEATFALWYGTHEAAQEGIIIVDMRLWQFDWYRVNVITRYPALAEELEPFRDWTALSTPVFVVPCVPCRPQPLYRDVD